MSLIAYERSCVGAEAMPRASRARRASRLAAPAHRRAFGRNYDDIEKLRTLDFVLLFIPVEAAFIEAVRADDEPIRLRALEEHLAGQPEHAAGDAAHGRASLAHRAAQRQREEIARRAALLHDNFALLVNELGTVGLALDKAQRAHASALRRLREGGKGSVLLQVQSLAEMGAPVKKQLSLLESSPGEMVDEAVEPEASDSDRAASSSDSEHSGRARKRDAEIAVGRSAQEADVASETTCETRAAVKPKLRRDAACCA